MKLRQIRIRQKNRRPHRTVILTFTEKYNPKFEGMIGQWFKNVLKHTDSSNDVKKAHQQKTRYRRF